MRVIVIVPDTFVSVDGEGYGKVDLSFLPNDVHAIQWYGTYGDVEYVDPVTRRAARNEQLESFTPYEQVLTAWATRKEQKHMQEIEEALAAQAAQEAIAAQEAAQQTQQGT